MRRRGYDSAVSRQLRDDEYKILSDQKADDWRAISAVNPTLFGVAGAIFAAGVAQHQSEVVALSTLPLYLGVWHMVRHARLQLQMITYLAIHAPPGPSWERDIADVRPKFWAETRGEKPAWLAELMRPSAWNTWLIITTFVSILAVLVPVFASYPDCSRAISIGIAESGMGSALVIWQSRKIQPERERWTQLWTDHQRATERD
jgi:hypothetical protein